MRHAVTPVLQLGWVGIDLIDSDVIILIYVASSLACCCWLAVGWQNSNRDFQKYFLLPTRCQLLCSH